MRYELPQRYTDETLLYPRHLTFFCWGVAPLWLAGFLLLCHFISAESAEQILIQTIWVLKSKHWLLFLARPLQPLYSCFLFDHSPWKVCFPNECSLCNWTFPARIREPTTTHTVRVKAGERSDFSQFVSLLVDSSGKSSLMAQPVTLHTIRTILEAHNGRGETMCVYNHPHIYGAN